MYLGATDPAIKRRQAIEVRIVKSAVKELLAAGYKLTVDDGERMSPVKSTNRKAILAALYNTDEDYLIADKDGKRSWVRFVYGNDGWDVINDYTVDLDAVLVETNKLVDKLQV